MEKTFEVDQAIIDKWMPLLEGKDKWENFVKSCPKLDEKHYATVAQMLENTEQMKLEERTTTTQGVGSFSPILIPMLRRIMPSLISMEIVGTQPMSGPTGLIFALRAVYQNTTDNPVNRANSIIITVANVFDGTDTATVGNAISASLDDSVANPVEDGIGIVRHIEGNNLLVEVSSGDFTTAMTVNYKATVTQNTGIDVAARYDNEALYKIIFSNYTGTYTTSNGENLSTDMKEIGFNIETATTTAKTRKLKAKWTEELEQDLQAIHNMNAERLLTSIASDEIVIEMNQEMIKLLRTKATTVTAFDFATADGRWELELYQNLMAVISRVKRQIAIANRRGQATFMIVSPDVLSAIEASGKLSTVGVDPIQNSFAGMALGLKVFVDIFATNDDILMGYKGPTEIDAGVFWSPYIPLQIRKGFGEEDGQPRTFFHTRYGIVDNIYGAENYYQTITVAGMGDFTS